MLFCIGAKPQFSVVQIMNSKKDAQKVQDRTGVCVCVFVCVCVCVRVRSGVSVEWEGGEGMQERRLEMRFMLLALGVWRVVCSMQHVAWSEWRVVEWEVGMGENDGLVDILEANLFLQVCVIVSVDTAFTSPTT